MPLSQQLRGLEDELYDVGFAQSADVGDAIVAEPAWSDPLVMGDPQHCEGYDRQIARLLRSTELDTLVAEQVSSLDLLLTLVAAGYALALIGASHFAACKNPDVVCRPLAGRSPMLTTWLMRRDVDPSETLARFIDRVSPMGPELAPHV